MIRIPKNCTGCTACIEICPKECISSSENIEGFMMPLVNPLNCIECGLCENVCPVLNIGHKNDDILLLVGQNRNKEILKNSSSGGIFSLIATKILELGGVVYGVAIDYDNNETIKHIRIADINELKKLQGSKYVQSDISGIFRKVLNDLKIGLKVLFSGTPCQVAGLKRFLRKDYENLICVDIICHGVPSPSVWRKYLEFITRPKGVSKNTDSQLNSYHLNDIPEISGISFRDKRLGWKKYGFAIHYAAPKGGQNSDSQSTICPKEENPKDFFEPHDDNLFMRCFLNDLCLRLSCYDCPVKGFSSGADITLADAWGVENFFEFQDLDKGVSLVIPQSNKGKHIVTSLNVEYYKVPVEILTKYNPSAFVSPHMHKNRKKFFKLIANGTSFQKIIDICLPPPTLMDKVKWSINKRLKRLKNE